MERLLLVANPAASSFTGASLRAVTDVLRRRYEVDTAWPTDAAGSRIAAAEAAAAGYAVVAAMGGDGVAHHVANGLVHTETALAVVPAGTTNVVARIIGLPARPARAAAALIKAESTLVSLAHVTDGHRSDHALFALGVGFDADVVEDAERRPHAKGTIGSLHYVRSAARIAVGTYRSKAANMRVTCDGRQADAVAVMVQVHHPYTYFGRVPLSFAEDTEEGPAALSVAALPVRRAASIVARAVAGRDVARAPGVDVWHGFHKLLVEADPAAPLQADGDLLGSGDYFEITPAPGALRMLLPG